MMSFYAIFPLRLSAFQLFVFFFIYSFNHRLGRPGKLDHSLEVIIGQYLVNLDPESGEG